MTFEIDRIKAEVAATARMMAAAGLVEGFGHASTRLAGGGFLMTSTSPLLSHTAGEILTCDDEGNAIDAPAGKPLEIVIHAGIYRARPDVGRNLPRPRRRHGGLGRARRTGAAAARHGRPGRRGRARASGPGAHHHARVG